MNENQTVSQNRVTALYVRVSTQDQSSGMDSQLRTLKEFCEKNNITRFEVFADEGISGGKVSRPALDRMMSLVREGKIDRVIVYSFSRYARSVTHLLNGLEEFKKMNVSFTSYTEKVDTESPMGRAFFVIIAAISQLERELIVERVKNGLKNAKIRGKLIGRRKTRPSELIRQLLKKISRTGL
jgi:DNA invertase Pin-like site-specific DNA recombinase